jgi:hypothetical protein
MASTQTRWQIAGDYFENCNCNVVCPCLFSPKAPLTAQPTAGACEIAFAFHIDQGNYDDITLDSLNIALIVRTPGPMAEGNWTVALYLDERADEQQRQGLQAIFTGSVGGPLAALAPLISRVLGVKTAPITFHKEGKQRSVEIPHVMQLAIHAVPSMNPDEEIWAKNAHPFASSIALAVGDEQSTWADYSMRWDNSGKNAHYAPINWSNT